MGKLNRFGFLSPVCPDLHGVARHKLADHVVGRRKLSRAGPVFIGSFAGGGIGVIDQPAR